MKKIKLFGYFIVTCAVIVCFILAVGNSGNTVKDLPISNIEALEQEQEQDGGGMLWCDKTDEDVCAILTPSGIGYSKGFLRYIEY